MVSAIHLADLTENLGVGSLDCALSHASHVLEFSWFQFHFPTFTAPPVLATLASRLHYGVRGPARAEVGLLGHRRGLRAV